MVFKKAAKQPPKFKMTTRFGNGTEVGKGSVNIARAVKKRVAIRNSKKSVNLMG